MKRLAATCLAAAAALVPAAAAQAQDQPIATLDGSTPIAAFGGRLVWSKVDRASGNWTLMTRAGGPTQAVPIPPRRVPFDVDLGPDAGGATVAVYSRCAQDPPVGSGFAPTLYNRGIGCDLYRYDFVAGTERRIADASAPDASEFFPTIWRDRLAFGRTYDSKPTLPYVYARSVSSAGRSVRLPGGPRNACVRDRATGRTSCTPATQSRPMSLELYGTRLGFAWTFAGTGEGLDTEIRMDTIGAGRTVVARQKGGGLTQVQLGWPAFESGRLYWDVSCFGDESGCPGRFGLRRYRISTGAIERADGPAAVLSHERDAGVSHVLVDTMPGVDCLGDPPVPGGTCSLRAPQPAFG